MAMSSKDTRGEAPKKKCKRDARGNGHGTLERKPTAWGLAKTEMEYDTERRETSRRTGTETLSKTYDANGDIVGERLTNSATGAFVESRSTYDAKHRIASIGTGFNSTPVQFTSLTWDDRRCIPNRITSPSGRTTEWIANGTDIIVYGAGTNDSRSMTQILMTGDERPAAIISPDGGRTDMAYDESGYVTNIMSSCLPPVSIGYDALGNVNSISLPSGDGSQRTMTLSNNWRGMPLSISHPDDTSEYFEYDGNGRRPVRHVDALGREDIYSWVMGKPLHAGRVINGETNTLFGVSYDMQLNVVAITDPLGRNAETYVLDENERVVAVTNVEGQAMTSEYAVGNIVSNETRFDGSVVSYDYDSNGNVSSIAYPGEVLNFFYDADGLLTSASNSTGVVSNEYDAATGWLLASQDANEETVSYTRRNGGGVATMTTPAGITVYSHDVADRWTHIASSGAVFSLGYDRWNGRLSAITNGNGLVTEFACDIMDRVTNITWHTANGVTLGGFEYAYDALGRIVSRNHMLGTNAFGRAYTYDDMDRLASDGDTDYTYDAAGNRTTKTDSAGTINYTLGIGDRLASWTGGAYTYDTAGNVTRIVREGKPTLDLTWNSQYQLVSVATNGFFAESYAYDALGRRASTATLEGTTRHVYDSNWQCVADLDEQGNVISSYTWGEGIDKLLAVNICGATYYPLTDIQGTVWGYADSSNSIVARWQYDAWGNMVAEDVSIPALGNLRYRFQGREWSAATGLINFRMRWYDGETGRWLSKDPIGLHGGFNLYAPFSLSPVIHTDTLGLVDINLFPTNERINTYANLHSNVSLIVIGAHGTPNGIYGPTHTLIPAQQLAQQIRMLPRFQANTNMPILLDSCNVGNGGYPQQLANLLGVNVYAPTQFAWYYPTGNVRYYGRLSDGSPDTNVVGRIVVANPQPNVQTNTVPRR